VELAFDQVLCANIKKYFVLIYHNSFTVYNCISGFIEQIYSKLRGQHDH